MEQTIDQISEIPSLLTLNDDCIRVIFKFLQLGDFVSLAKTCTRLLCVAQQYKKFKNIAVRYVYDGPFIAEQEFSTTLSVIGDHVASVYIRTRNNFRIFKTIAVNCLNLTSVELTSCFDGSPVVRPLPFRNLKELKVRMTLDIFVWENCFVNNPGIENIEYYNQPRFEYYSYVNKPFYRELIPLLKMLPEIKSLYISDLQLDPDKFHHLTCLITLRKLSFSISRFSSKKTCNRLLAELAEKLYLVELEVTMPCNADTFAIFKNFRDLEVLAIGLCDRVNVEYLPETIVFPSMLKRIKLFDIEIYLSTVKQLKFLEEFYMGGYTKIVMDGEEYEYFPSSQPFGNINCSMIISEIANELRAKKRKLKIFYSDNRTENQVCQYSDHLQLIRRPLHVVRASVPTFTVM